jgi:transcriptional regulator with XRE-family HTH domain
MASDQRMTWQDFGPMLKQLRKRRGLSRETLASLLHYDRTYIYRLERGDRHPSAHLLCLIGKTFNLSEEETCVMRCFEQMAVYHVGELEVETVQAISGR